MNQSGVFTSTSDGIWRIVGKKRADCLSRSVLRIGQVFLRRRPASVIGTHTRRSLVCVLRPARAHTEQTVMRKRITVFHHQLSPAAPVRLKRARIAAGHAVAKEVSVSKQELAGKHPQS